MNKLQLAQRLWREGGIPGSISSTEAQSGEYLQVVDWIDSAYEEIFNLSPFWHFRRGEFTLPLANGDSTYTASDASLTDFLEWIPDDVRVYETTADEQWICYVPWEEFRLSFLMGLGRTVTGRPAFFSIKPDFSMMFHAIPDRSFTCLGEYRKKAVAMTLDAHIPAFPEQYHMAIVWNALTKFAAFHSEPDKFAHGNNEYAKMIRAMRSTQLPKMLHGAPLA